MRTKAKCIRFTLEADLRAEGFRYLAASKARGRRIPESAMYFVFAAARLMCGALREGANIQFDAARFRNALLDNPELTQVVLGRIGKYYNKKSLLGRALRCHPRVTVVIKGQTVQVPFEDAIAKEIQAFIQEKYRPDPPIKLCALTKARARMSKADAERFAVYYKGCQYIAHCPSSLTMSQHIRSARQLSKVVNGFFIPPGVCIPGVP